MRKILYALALCAFVSPAMAAEHNHAQGGHEGTHDQGAVVVEDAAPREAHEDIVIKVNGMVCDFCAQSVWKVFNDYDAVADVDIDLDAGSVTVHMNPGQSLDDAALDKAITYAGYELVGTERVQSPGHGV